MAGDKKPETEKTEKRFSRRAFVVGGGTALAGGALTAVSGATAMAAQGTKKNAIDYPLSTKYLVYDSKHCAGCLNCMMACSMVHEGATSLSLARIQVHRAVLNRYPQDIVQNICRQCPEPLCVDNCPTGACHVSAENGNVRLIDQEKCIGCQTCMRSCPYSPHRPIWNPVTRKATKCDLCVNTPYYNKKGGPDGTQACVEICPANALAVVDKLPDQADNRGYDRNLQPPPKKAPPFGAFPKEKPKAKTEAPKAPAN
ncbi:MAG: 4Fe-4S dicluster domain-containing protein [Acidobacteria bacterium]|nr:4Fe-4S dicluster domain-containing protein [Acidobacteriota bacterium]